MTTFTPRFNPNVLPIEYDLIVNWLQQNDLPVWVPKLGRLSRNGNLCHFWCSVTSQGLIIVSANEDGTGSSHVYSQVEWNQLCHNMQWAIDTGRNPEFTYWYTNDPRHPEAPHAQSRKWGPNVPAICRSFNECN